MRRRARTPATPRLAAALLAAALLAAPLTLSACSSRGPDLTPDGSPSQGPAVTSSAPGGSAATWQLTAPEATGASTTSLDIEVTRLECSSGVTGELLDPVVTYDVDEVVVLVDAVPLPAEGYDCPGNDAVAVTVELTEPLGDRALVDGGCLRTDARDTAPCLDALRLPPAG